MQDVVEVLEAQQWNDTVRAQLLQQAHVSVGGLAENIDLRESHGAWVRWLWAVWAAMLYTTRPYEHYVGTACQVAVYWASACC